MTIETDAISTTYYGFGGVIAGKPEIFTGSSGLSNVRLGDRVDIRGSVRGQGVFKADRITLLGRNVEAGSVGVGTTREPTSSSTPVDDRTTNTITTDTAGNVEGTIRSVNQDDGRLVIQTPQRRMITVRTYRNTPVLYRGESNAGLEPGSRRSHPRRGRGPHGAGGRDHRAAHRPSCSRCRTPARRPRADV